MYISTESNETEDNNSTTVQSYRNSLTFDSVLSETEDNNSTTVQSQTKQKITIVINCFSSNSVTVDNYCYNSTVSNETVDNYCYFCFESLCTVDNYCYQLFQFDSVTEDNYCTTVQF